jgi:hypothetical protein
MPYQQYKQGQTYFGYDPQSQQGIAFSDPSQFNKYFGSFDQNAAAPTFDTSKLMATPNQAISLAPAPTPQAAPAQPGAMPSLAAPGASGAPVPATPASPTAPTATPVMPDISGLENQYQQNMLPTADETQAQTDLSNLIASRDMGINNIRSQPIPMDIIRGFSQNILENANTQAQTLQQRLANLQAKRQASLEASKFSLQRADQQVAQTKEAARYQSELAQKQTDTQQKNQFDYANDVRQTAKIDLPFYKNPGSDQVYDSRTGEAVDYTEYKKRGGVGVPGAAFPDVQEIKPQQTDKLLTPTEAARLGVPYGTTQQQAAAASITPAFGKTSTAKTSSKSSSTSSGKVSSTQLADAFKTGWANEGYIQGNGKISSKDYKEAKAAWRQQGFTGAAFDNAMSDLIDKSSKNWKTDYGYGS